MQHFCFSGCFIIPEFVFSESEMQITILIMDSQVDLRHLLLFISFQMIYYFVWLLSFSILHQWQKVIIYHSRCGAMQSTICYTVHPS